MKRLVLAGKHVSHTAAADPRSESISAGQQDARSRQIDQRAITLDHLLSVPSCTSNALTPVESQLAGEPSVPLSPLPNGWEERSLQRGLAPTTIGPIRARSIYDRARSPDQVADEATAPSRPANWSSALADHPPLGSVSPVSESRSVTGHRSPIVLRDGSRNWARFR